MQKIVISSNTSWYIYNFRLNLARSLKKQGFEVILVAPKDKYSEKLKEEFKYHDIFMNNKGTNPIEDLKTIYEFYRLYKKIKPDVVLNFTIKPNIYGTIACNFLGIKTINNITGLGSLFISQNFATKIASFLYKFSQSKADKIFFQNRDDFDMFVKEKLVQKEKCDILPGSGVDIQKFKPIKVEKDNIFRFLLIARMIWEKGIKEYVKAAKIIKQKYENVEFLLLGVVGVDNPSAINMEQIKRWEQEKIIKYLGTSDDVKTEISKVNCVVLPSYREGTSRVLLESASLEKPLITSNVPGCNNIVDDGVNGFLCKLKDSQDLANKMEKMLSLSEEDRIKMGKNGRKKMIREFDEQIVIKKYLNTIEEILNS
jgi:glycosyltransferase involved in cell wall biosynthesis